jgi:CRP/FNR family cyclic AMP-dependent transcriptional regulator
MPNQPLAIRVCAAFPLLSFRRRECGTVLALPPFRKDKNMNDALTVPMAKRAFTAESLPDHPLFHGMGKKDRHILAECSMHAAFEPGNLVVETGEPANCFYLIISGLITLETLGAQSALRVQTIGSGDVLGWSWLFPPYYWHFNAIAAEPTETVFFYGSRLLQECDRNHDFGYELFRRMSQILVNRLRTTREKWIEAARFAPPRLGLPADYLII